MDRASRGAALAAVRIPLAHRPPLPVVRPHRGLFELAKGHWRAALHFNLLSPLAFAMVFALLWAGPTRARLWTAGLAAFAAYGVCRVFLPSV